MAKREDDFSFSFMGGKRKDEQPDAGESLENVPEEEKSGADDIVPGEQFRILIMGDFSGRVNRGAGSAGNVGGATNMVGRKIFNVDADNLDETLAKLKPEIRLPVGQNAVVPLTFKAMKDFHPDALLQGVEAFQALLKLRAKIQDARTFAEAAPLVRALMGGGATQGPTASGTASRPSESAPAAGGSDFERLLNQAVTPKSTAESNVQAMIANIAAGSSVPEADPEQAVMVKFLEDAVSAGLRAVLRHPAFQAVESAWRGVEFLVTRLDTDEDLKLAILDVSKEELAADLAGAAKPSELHRLLIEQMRVPGAVPFSLLIGDYEFEQSPEDIALLAKIAGLMREARIPFIAGASARVAGVPSFFEFPDSGKWQPPADGAMWDKIRGHNDAAHVGLTAPRFLIRMPYGPKTDAIETFPFEEMPGTPARDAYLWANGAFAVALLTGEAFLESGWDGPSNPGNDVSDLPCHMALIDGEREMTPCAQAYLSDRVGDILHQLGLIPLLSIRNAAAIKVAGIHSIAKPTRALAASWTTT